ncbi:hypothetical protein Acsp05_29750 [Actinokineospora sp. NBRC 105648]|nr:hypothetical protein Acsp05_29750 [Actinokineospora sp. NBRC 105648]
MSRAEATTRLGLTRTAIGDAARWLTDLGVLSAEHTAPVGRGRPSPLLGPDERGPVVVAAHLLPRRVDVAVVGLGASPGPKRAYPLSGEDAPAKVLRVVAGRIAAAARRAGRPCVGVAVGLAGMTRAGGVARNAVHFNWDHVPAQELLAEHLPMPVLLENDSGLTALAEYRRGAGRHAGTVLVLSCAHTGIGGALLGDGVFPPGGHVLEAGHVSIDLDGLPCTCGQLGCLEMYSDGQSILRALGAADVDDQTALRSVLDRAWSTGSAEARVALTAADRLGVGLASMVNLLAPERVVLSGVLGELYRLGAAEVRARLNRSIVARADGTEIVVGTVADPVLVGAAELAFEGFLAQPQDFAL